MKNLKVFAVAALVAGIAQAAHAQTGGQAADDQRPLTHDQLRVAVQKICPVSGETLGSKVAPIKATIGREEMYVCCRECLGSNVNPDHWATIHASSAKAQGKCPVMNRPLPKEPKSTIVEGQLLYICCPPCADKIQADPKAYLRKVDQLYADSLKAGQASR